MSNSSLFEELVDVARTLPESRYPLGGNAPVMAKRWGDCRVTCLSRDIVFQENGIVRLGVVALTFNVHCGLMKQVMYEAGKYLHQPLRNFTPPYFRDSKQLISRSLSRTRHKNSVP